ncbi:aldo/keto reductase [Helicobacter suis]|uniref:aldo/keto reductase n=1 Tax=Helicobacter suis TaxID=104628 RepID=UPI0013D63365|nr:aldo/keto reductase [Helicobacter suis]
MQQKQLGSLKVSALALGIMGMTFGYGETHNKQEMIKLIHQAFEHGINFFDTAEAYGADNEELLGEAIKPFRDKVVIASKFGISYKDPNNKHATMFLDSSLNRTKRALEGSLKRLGVECLDLYYQHRVDTNTPIEEVADLMQTFIKEGKIKAWGMSEAGLSSIQKAHAVCPLSALQSEYSLWWREPEKEILGFLEKNNIGFVAFSPLGKGFLGAKFEKNATFASSDFRSTVPKFNPENMAKNYPLVEFIKDHASQKGITPAQLALSWILHTQKIVVPLFGTTKESRLLENLGALQVSWSDEELEAFNKGLASIKIEGSRYPERLNSMVGK